MNFGSLFTGIGGIDLGFERAGLKCLWQVEWDDYCQRVLAKHGPQVERFSDVRDVGEHNLHATDVICGGFPCQPVSLTGRRKAQADERWLWPEFARVVRELRPSYIVVENVPGLYTAGGSEVLADLAEIGYDAEWDSISAEALGAVHKRQRFFLVGYPFGGRLSGVYRRRAGEESEDGRSQVADSERKGLEGHAGDGNDGNKPRREYKITTGSVTEGGVSSRERERYEGWWTTEPSVGRVAYGVPARVDRLRALGNAVVPQAAEWIGRRLVELERK